ncbi:MAG TPA: RHS repeat-associated core domain-containing protein, partial [Bacteroidales bacterium]|nr:RHS repeat-associated core domain-containing protein [Bacteroidales bacterium]
RTYNDWELLTEQSVVCEGDLYFKATYQYDALQRITQTTEVILDDTVVIDYAYNAAGQLQAVYKNGLQTESYTYDSHGNWQTVAKEGFEYVCTTNVNNRLETYLWEESGNTRLVDFAYNNSGQLSRTENKTVYNGYPQTTSSRDYNYDVFGNLNSVTWASQVREYIYDGYDRQIATYQNGTVKHKLIYGLGSTPIAELNENDRIINTFVYADSHTPVLMRKGNTDYYIISDIRGSVRMVIKATTGAIRQQLEYDAFGKVLADNNPGYTPFGYAGGLYDYRTDLIRFGARDYYPEIGRWTAEDPIGFLSGDVNFYAYCANDPVNYLDLTGLSKISGGFADRSITRVFWSGGEKAMNAAANYAKAKGMTTLEMTRAGSNLTNLAKGFPWSKAGPLWQRLSTAYAKGAKGTVHVFHNSRGIGTNSVWRTIEYPILKQNGVNIIYHVVP